MTTTPAEWATGRGLARRRRHEAIAKGFLFVASGTSLVILAVLLTRLAIDGVPALSAAFFTNPYSPLNIRTGTAGILDAIWASVVVLALTMLFAVPLGVGGAVYLNEYATKNRFTDLIETTIANLAGVPSVVYGLLGLAVFVRFLALGATMLTAALTMATLVLPIILVATQEALKAVPDTVRQASYGLGATKWQTVRHHILPTAMSGILTGNILAMSRAAGETAPLLVITLPVYTTLIGFAPTDPGTPLQLRIYYLAQDPRVAAHELAAGAIVVLVAVTLLLNLSAILLRNRYNKLVQW